MAWRGRSPETRSRGLRHARPVHARCRRASSNLGPRYVSVDKDTVTHDTRITCTCIVTYDMIRRPRIVAALGERPSEGQEGLHIKRE